MLQLNVVVLLPFCCHIQTLVRYVWVFFLLIECIVGVFMSCLRFEICLMIRFPTLLKILKTKSKSFLERGLEEHKKHVVCNSISATYFKMLFCLSIEYFMLGNSNAEKMSCAGQN